ncbi:hypothetical protein [Synechococcus sp. M16CYN]|uniref:hypothetical protein n=1 Tax=Synechococcus sp. M16CYN TaxID=3103139 RepID=UPI0033407B64
MLANAHKSCILNAIAATAETGGSPLDVHFGIAEVLVSFRWLELFMLLCPDAVHS